MKTIDAVFRETESYTGITRQQLVCSRRFRIYAGARKYFSQLAMEGGFNIYEIADALNKDRTSILHYLKTDIEIPVKEYVEQRPVIRAPKGLIRRNGEIVFEKGRFE